MIRVLQCVNNMHRAGLETMLMNYYRNIDRTKIQFDFLTHRPDRSDYDDEIESMGGKVYYAPRLYPQNYPAYFSYMRNFFRDHPEYKIVHSHIDAMSYLPLLAAKRAGVPVRIAHSHNTSIDHDFKYPLKQFFRFRLPTVANRQLACGKEAGRFLFRNDLFRVIPNAVEGNAFRFSDDVRRQKRDELGIRDQLVIGHIGRLSFQKNHQFLLQIFCEIQKREPSAILLLVGTGKLEKEIMDLALKLGVQRNVRFLGNRSDVNELYQAMDVFVLPSHYEGLPVVGIEAQFSGLPCFFSDAITKEAAFSDRCQFLSLNKPAGYWAEKILESHRDLKDRNCAVCSEYDVKYAYHILEDYYFDLYSQILDKTPL